MSKSTILTDAERAFRDVLVPLGYDGDVLSVSFQIYRSTQEAIARAEAEVLRPAGISWVSYVTLMTLWARGASEVRMLAQAQVATKAAVVKSLDALERQGLARRVRSKRDRRLVTVEITPRGSALIKRVQADLHVLEHRLTHALSAAEKRQLAGLLRKLDTSRTAGE